MRRLRSAFWLFGIALGLLVIFLPGYTKLQELKDRNRQLAQDIEKIRKENVLLEIQLSHIQKDPLYQEKIVREKMGLVRKGEILYKIEPEE